MERWAMSQVYDLSTFYNGIRGSMTRAVCIVITTLFILAFEKMQEIRKDGIEPLLSGIIEIPLVNKWPVSYTHLTLPTKLEV